jgi:DNA-binding transcriptional LysR family regulator
MNIESLDLNLLLAFEALTAERNVSKAGNRIGLSQPAMSNALARLRAVFDDRLFVHLGREMVPTTRTLQLASPVLEALSKIRAAIGDRSTFDPVTAENVFRVAATDYAEIILISRLIRTIKRKAPKVGLGTL